MNGGFMGVVTQFVASLSNEHMLILLWFAGDKVACFAPEHFTDSQSSALNEYCWTNGFWVSEGVPMVKSLYTQPHRFYPLYLPIQVSTYMYAQ